MSDYRGLIEEMEAARKTKTGRAINIMFDGPPGPEAGRFIECELDSGVSVKIGEWIRHENGLYSLRITESDILGLPPTLGENNVT